MVKHSHTHQNNIVESAITYCNKAIAERMATIEADFIEQYVALE